MTTAVYMNSDGAKYLASGTPPVARSSVDMQVPFPSADMTAMLLYLQSLSPPILQVADNELAEYYAAYQAANP